MKTACLICFALFAIASAFADYQDYHKMPLQIKHVWFSKGYGGEHKPLVGYSTRYQTMEHSKYLKKFKF